MVQLVATVVEVVVAVEPFLVVVVDTRIEAVLALAEHIVELMVVEVEVAVAYIAVAVGFEVLVKNQARHMAQQVNRRCTKTVKTI